jgi:hypothetical protein
MDRAAVLALWPQGDEGLARPALSHAAQAWRTDGAGDVLEADGVQCETRAAMTSEVHTDDYDGPSRRHHAHGRRRYDLPPWVTITIALLAALQPFALAYLAAR